MIDLFLVGIGMGNPDHLTAQAVGALRSADLILIPEKGDKKSDLADLRTVHQMVTRPERSSKFAFI